MVSIPVEHLDDEPTVTDRGAEPGAVPMRDGPPARGDARTGGPHGSAFEQRAAIQLLSVAELVDLASKGGQSAWEEMVNRFGGMIAAVGRRYGLSSADVAELQQTTWLRLVENFHRIEQPERIAGWLATTARRESLQLLRRAARYSVGADQMLANLPDTRSPEPDARPIAEERDALLREAWDGLKPRCRELLSMLFVDEPLAYTSLSEVLKMPVGSIGPTRARCLEHLRRLVVEAEAKGRPLPPDGWSDQRRDTSAPVRAS